MDSHQVNFDETDILIKACNEILTNDMQQPYYQQTQQSTFPTNSRHHKCNNNNNCRDLKTWKS